MCVSVSVSMSVSVSVSVSVCVQSSEFVSPEFRPVIVCHGNISVSDLYLYFNDIYEKNF